MAAPKTLSSRPGSRDLATRNRQLEPASLSLSLSLRPSQLSSQNPNENQPGLVVVVGPGALK